MTDKKPVYWRTKDGHKGVLLSVKPDGNCWVYVPDLIGSIHCHIDDLTEWKEPVTKEVWVQLWSDGLYSCNTVKRLTSDVYAHKLLAQKKITITEGEFDE